MDTNMSFVHILISLEQSTPRMMETIRKKKKHLIINQTNNKTGKVFPVLMATFHSKIILSPRNNNPFNEVLFQALTCTTTVQILELVWIQSSALNKSGFKFTSHIHKNIIKLLQRKKIQK